MPSKKNEGELLLSDRAFWIAVAVYALLVGSAVVAFGKDTRFEANPDISSGTLIFGPAPVAHGPGAVYRLKLGAVTLRVEHPEHISRELPWPVREPFLSLSIKDLPEIRKISRADSTAFVWQSAPELTAADMAGGMEIASMEEEAVVPEAPTWLPLICAAAAIFWSFRRSQRLRIRVNVIAVLASGIAVPLCASGARGGYAARDFGDYTEQSDHPRFLEALQLPGALLDTRPLDLAASAANNINLSGRQNLTLSGVGDETVSIALLNFSMSGSSILTLQGTAATHFIITVSKQFRLAGTAKIKLSGLAWNNVLFNVVGAGAVTLSGSSYFCGILKATQRLVTLTNAATVVGTVAAKKLVILGRARIITPSVVSP